MQEVCASLISRIYRNVVGKRAERNYIVLPSYGYSLSRAFDGDAFLPPNKPLRRAMANNYKL